MVRCPFSKISSKSLVKIKVHYSVGWLRSPLFPSGNQEKCLHGCFTRTLAGLVSLPGGCALVGLLLLLLLLHQLLLVGLAFQHGAFAGGDSRAVLTQSKRSQQHDAHVMLTELAFGPSLHDPLIDEAEDKDYNG